MTPVDPDRFERELASAVNALIADPAARDAMGRAARRRAVELLVGVHRAADGRALPLAASVRRVAAHRRFVCFRSLPPAVLPTKMGRWRRLSAAFLPRGLLRSRTGQVTGRWVIGASEAAESVR